MKRAVLLLAVATAACDATFRFDDQSVDAGSDASAGPCRDSAACHGLRCDRETGLCVACTDDDDCTTARPRCDRAQHVCVECREDEDCGADGRCEPTTHRCVERCTTDDPACATAGFACRSSAGICVECAEDANCASVPGGPFCDALVGRCVECTSNVQCASSAAVCDRRTGHCATCVSSTTCGLGRVCDPVSLSCRVP